MWSSSDGEVGSKPIHGFYHSESRVFSSISLTVGGEVPEPIAQHLRRAGAASFVSLLRRLDGPGADPRVRLDRARVIGDGTLRETLTLTSARAAEIQTVIRIDLIPDFSEIQLVKAGISGEGSKYSISRTGDGGGGAAPNGQQPRNAEPNDAEHGGTGSGVEGWSTPVVLTSGSITARVRILSEGADDASITVPGDDSLTLQWSIRLPAHGSVALSWSVDVVDEAAVVEGTGEVTAGSEGVLPVIRSGDSRLANWVMRALDDVHGLRMVTKALPDEPFLAAGAPWFFTLFGRDSIWAARFMLPFGTELAASTLRVLAALQGTAEVADTAEQPGKIMHELRPGVLNIPGEDVSLPPLYFGTVDATPLWIVLLHDAWKWGLADAEVEALLPNLVAALEWMRDYGDSDGDGFLEYVDTTGHGLANQGWKDSGDSIQWRDGSLAEGPIALCEVQAYAYEAAVGGAALLQHFGHDASPWLDWADALKARFDAAFWIDDPDGAYPAVALDVNKQRVDTVTSNIGHLLGTGLIPDARAGLIARRLVSPDLSSGFGLRTMSADSAGFWPLSYHGGSVWTHDTTIAISGLVRQGFTAEAAVLIEGLLAAAAGFDYRMPELHSGDALVDVGSPVAYPAACRPQAWSAAAAVSVLASALGLEPDAQGGSLAVRPIIPVVAGTLHVEGLRFAGSPLGDLDVDADGVVVGRA
nr:glycogen debranching N-terminal domain-containing protein [Subtercola sp. PAMC28395]